jgi:hypothetical protein
MGRKKQILNDDEFSIVENFRNNDSEDKEPSWKETYRHLTLNCKTTTCTNERQLRSKYNNTISMNESGTVDTEDESGSDLEGTVCLPSFHRDAPDNTRVSRNCNLLSLPPPKMIPARKLKKRKTLSWYSRTKMKPRRVFTPPFFPSGRSQRHTRLPDL